MGAVRTFRLNLPLSKDTLQWILCNGCYCWSGRVVESFEPYRYLTSSSHFFYASASLSCWFSPRQQMPSATNPHRNKTPCFATIVLAFSTESPAFSFLLGGETHLRHCCHRLALQVRLYKCGSTWVGFLGLIGLTHDFPFLEDRGHLTLFGL